MSNAKWPVLVQVDAILNAQGEVAVSHPLPPDILREIGDMTVSFAMLESTIQDLHNVLLTADHRVGNIVASQLSFARLRTVTLSLMIHRHGKGQLFESLKSLMGLAAQIETERNAITHSVWGLDADDSIVRIKATCREARGFDVGIKRYDATALHAFNDDIRRLTLKVQRLNESLPKG
jgi:hypothetical protein